MREYVAFISYRHKPLDMAVARKVHRMIERYIIPAALRQNGRKKLGYVFRDQDELPLSSNLSDSISQALDHSEYLIVICTPDLPKSKWCLREINYFLEHHDRSHILAVLADGTPEESFPDVLCHEYDAQGALLGDVEPLAANIAAETQGKTMRLLDKEYLRLIAALLQCPYDSLVNRQRRRRVRQLTAAMSLALIVMAVFAGSMAYKNHIIGQKNDELAQANESITQQNVLLEAKNKEISAQYRSIQRYESDSLAQASDNALTVELDRLKAILLALRGLPTKEQNRPYSAQAERALAAALNAYGYTKNALDVSVSLPRRITQLIPVRDRQVLILGDDHMTAFVDLATGQILWNQRLDQLMEFNFQGMREWVACDAAADLAWFCVGSKVACVSLTDGQLRWQQESHDLHDLSMPYGLFARDGSAWIYWRDNLNGAAKLLCMSSEDGSLSSTAVWQEASGVLSELKACELNGLFLTAVDPDGIGQTELHAVVPNRGEVWNLAIPGHLLDMQAIDDQVYIVTNPQGLPQTSEDGTWTIAKETQLCVTCVDASGLRWNTEAALGEPCSFEGKTIWMMVKSDELALAVHNNVLTFSTQNGDLHARTVTSTPIIGQSASLGVPIYFLADGIMEPLMQSMDMLYTDIMGVHYSELGYKPALITDAKDGTLLTVLADQPWSVKTSLTVRDPHAVAVNQIATGWWSWLINSDSSLLIGAKEMTDSTTFTWLETAGLTETASCEVPMTLKKLLGVTSTDAHVLWQGMDGTCYRTAPDGVTQAFAQVSLTARIATMSPTADMPMQLLIAETDLDQLRFAAYADGVLVSEGTTDLMGTGSCMLSNLCVGQNGLGTIRWQADTEAGWLTYELSSGKITVLRDDKSGNKPASTCLAGTQPWLASADGDGTVRVLNARTGDTVTTTQPFPAGVKWMIFLDSDRLLLTLTNNNWLVSVAADSGKVCYVSKESQGLLLPAATRVCETADEVLLWADDGSRGGVIIDRSSMTVKAIIPDMVGYAHSWSQVITRQDTQLAAYRKYTLDELILWGEDRVKDRPLNQIEEIETGLWSGNDSYAAPPIE